MTPRMAIKETSFDPGRGYSDIQVTGVFVVPFRGQNLKIGTA